MKKNRIADMSTGILRQPKSSGESKRPILSPTLTIMAHPLMKRVGDRAFLTVLASGGEAPVSRNHPDFTPPGKSLGLPLGDPFLSRRPLRFRMGDHQSVQLFASDSGTKVIADSRPLRDARSFSETELQRGVVLELSERIVLLLHWSAPDIGGGGASLGMVGASMALRRVRGDIRTVSDLDVPVLVRGETGSGKELAARAIHLESARRDRPFVSVNLGAIPKDLAAAELFGVLKGAFTGAVQNRDGYFRSAHRGVLFLDEVGEASHEVQVLLLRVLESGELYPVGGHTPFRVDVRLIAATDADLEGGVRSGQFKAPLLHRLSGYEIWAPPLRERAEDIGRLFVHFAREDLEKTGELHRLSNENPFSEPWLPTKLAARLIHFPWPGNIRQLRNVVRQLIIGSRGKQHLSAGTREDRLFGEEEAESIAAGEPRSKTTPAVAKKQRRKPADISEQELVDGLRANFWDLQATADHLRIARTSVYELIQKSESVRTAVDLSPAEITRCYHECGGDLEAMMMQLEVSQRALRRRVKELGLVQPPK